MKYIASFVTKHVPIVNCPLVINWKTTAPKRCHLGIRDEEGLLVIDHFLLFKSDFLIANKLKITNNEGRPNNSHAKNLMFVFKNCQKTLCCYKE